MDKDMVRAACEQLCIAFSYHLDHDEFEEVVQLFAPDGVFVRNGERIVGQEAIRMTYADRVPATTMHIVSNFHLIESDGKRARSSVYNFVVGLPQKSSQVLRFDPQEAIRMLDFADEYVLTDKGWRFASRDARPVFQSLNWPY
jgi:hypothetical protein